MTDTTTRQALPIEVAKWMQFRSFYLGELTNTMGRLKIIGETSNWLQSEIDRRGLPVTVSNSASVQHVQNLIKHYNTLGRIISGVDLGKYRIHFRDNDFDVRTHIGTPVEQYVMDQYSSLGAIPLVVVVVGGAVLISGALLAVKKLNTDAKKAELAYKTKILEADKEIIKLGGTAAQQWQSIREAAKQSGVLAKIFGSDMSRTMGMILIGGLVIVGLLYLSKLRKRKS